MYLSTGALNIPSGRLLVAAQRTLQLFKITVTSLIINVHQPSQ
jgi:hypothetical protein